MQVTHNALVLVADGRKWLMFRNHGDAGQIDLRTDGHQERRDRKDSEIKTDSAGSQAQRFGDARPSMDETDFHRQEEDRFAEDLADLLKQRALSNDFDALIVVAAPRTLGVLRAQWHKEVASRIVAEIAKDMTGRPTPDIEALLAGEAHPPS